MSRRHSLLKRGQDATVEDIVSALCIISGNISQCPHSLQKQLHTTDHFHAAVEI